MGLISRARWAASTHFARGRIFGVHTVTCWPSPRFMGLLRRSIRSDACARRSVRARTGSQRAVIDHLDRPALHDGRAAHRRGGALALDAAGGLLQLLAEPGAELVTHRASGEPRLALDLQPLPRAAIRLQRERLVLARGRVVEADVAAG